MTQKIQSFKEHFIIEEGLNIFLKMSLQYFISPELAKSIYSATNKSLL